MFSPREVWQHRELLYFLSLRDIRVRYSQAILGVVWVVLQPVLSMVVLTVFFGWFVRVPSDGLPYALFNYVAMLVWTYLSGAVNRGTSSLLSSSSLITKVYFPRVIVPASAVIPGLLDFLIGLIFLIPIMLHYEALPPLKALVYVPILLAITAALAFSLSLWLSALTAQYRDVSYVLPFAIQVWMYATPILYPLSVVPESVRWMIQLNPAVGVVENFRAALLGVAPNFHALSFSVGVVFVLFITGTFYFYRVERSFADVI